MTEAPPPRRPRALLRYVVVAVLVSAAAFWAWQHVAARYWAGVVAVAEWLHPNARFRLFISHQPDEGEFSPLVAYLALVLAMPHVALRRRLKFLAGGGAAIVVYDFLKALSYSPALVRPGVLRDVWVALVQGQGRLAIVLGLGMLLIGFPPPAQSPKDTPSSNKPPLRRPLFIALVLLPVLFLLLLLDVRPSPAEVLVNQGDFFYRTDLLQPAVDSYLEALDLDPTQLRASLRAGEILLKQGRAGDARSVLESALARAPRNLSLNVDLAQALDYGTGAASNQRYGAGFDVVAARAQWRRVELLDPGVPDLYRHLGKVDEYDDQGRLHGPGYPQADAVRCYREALRRRPADTAAALYLSNLLALQRDWRGAVLLWRHILQVEPDNTVVRGLLDSTCQSNVEPSACPH